MAKCELLEFYTEHEIRLYGAYFEGDPNLPVVVHIHGACGNFYESPLVHVLADQYTRNGISLFSINLRAHDCIAEGYSRDDSFRYVGGSVEEFTSCLADIDSALDIMKKRHKEIVLQGHSLGCDRALLFALTRGFAGDLVLLAPCDSRDLHVKYIHPRSISEQLDWLATQSNDNELALLGPDQYGARNDGEEYFVPLTARALRSLITGPAFQLLSLEQRSIQRTDGRALAIIGSRDPLLTHRQCWIISVRWLVSLQVT